MSRIFILLLNNKLHFHDNVLHIYYTDSNTNNNNYNHLSLKFLALLL